VDEQDESEYEVQSFLAPEDLGYDVKEREEMCIDAAEFIPNAHHYLRWLKSVPGEEKFYAVQIEHERYVSREVVSAFECPTAPPFYLQTFVDQYFSRSVWIILNEKQFSVRTA